MALFKHFALTAVIFCGVLLPYQKAWINDKSPLKIWLKARQIGFSFSATFRVVTDLVRRKTLWVVLSAGQRQAIELAHKAKEHIEAIAKIEQNARGYEFVEKEFFGIVDGVETTQSVIHLPANRARAIFLPSNPETARGYSGNVLADEFAMQRDAKRIYAAIYPSITRGFSLEIGSTPFGESGMFWELCTKENGFSKHRTTIYEAVEQGLQADIKQLRDGCPDEDIWQQEYCCQFISDATSWIPWDLISKAESCDATLDLREGFAAQGQLFLGVDIGRRKDLTVLCLVERVGDVFWVRAVKRMRAASFQEQREAIEGWISNLGIRRACQDASGLGMQMAEELVQKFGSRVEAVTFNLAVKEDLMVRLRRNFEQSTIRIPEDRELRAAIHAIRRIPTAAGNFRFDADRTEAGHADEAFALALALMAADAQPAALAMSDDEFLPRKRTSAARDLFGDREPVTLGICERERRLW